MKKSLPAAFLILLSACNGGPCEYEKRPFKATIVSISDEKVPSPYGSDRENREMGYQVKVLTDVRGKDTLNLHEMVGQTITDEYLKEHELKEGTVLTGEVNLITSGTCSDDSYRFSDSTLNVR